MSRQIDNHKHKKRIVFARDKQRCTWCHRFLTWDLSTLDHWVPKSLHGNDEVENLVLSCSVCNNMRGKIGPRKFDKFINYILNSPRNKNKNAHIQEQRPDEPSCS